MKVYLRGVLLKTRHSARIMQVVAVYQVGLDVVYELKPLVRGPWVRIPHASINRFYTPIGMGLIEPELEDEPENAQLPEAVEVEHEPLL